MQPTNDHYVDQSPDALMRTEVEGDLDLEQFDVLREGSFRPLLRDVSVRARIIGASHVLSFDINGDAPLQFHEIVACVGVREAKGALLSDSMGLRMTRKVGSKLYTFTAESAPWEGGEPNKLQMLLSVAEHATNFGGVGFVHEFPSGELPETPKTVILAGTSSNDDAIAISTAHSYPGQGVVFTRTTLRY